MHSLSIEMQAYVVYLEFKYYLPETQRLKC